MPTFSFSLQSVETMIELGSFLLAGSVVIIVLNKIKNTKEIIHYKNKEKEYQELLTTLQKENEIYQKEITARDEFLSIASHELKTPLSAMLLQIQNALHNIRSVSLANFSVENLLKMLQSTEQQSKRLSKMINDLLNVSLITTGKMELEKEKFDVGELVMDVTDRLSERAEREGSKISLKIQEKVIGNFDKLRIEQAITNLVSNAIKYGEGKSIAVEVNKDNHTINIIVSDHGIGIPKEQQQKIFERFERAVSQHDYKGLGVGLYITQHIVATHGGKITVKSKETEGTTFTISLPVE
jgi:signal transduction histidine kinase